MDVFRSILVFFVRLGELCWVHAVRLGTTEAHFVNLKISTVLKIGGQFAFASQQRLPSLPPGLTRNAQRSNHVWELHSPENPDVEIVLFHGLQMVDFEDAFWKTWLARDIAGVIWPKDWLTKKLPNARILSMTYNTSVMRVKGQLDRYALGENLVSDIIRDSSLNLGQNCPVFLVGHSLGGIVIKQFILSAIKAKTSSSDTRDVTRIKTFLNNFKGVFYYGTPHKGSKVADFIRDARLPNTSDLLVFLSTLDTEKQRINAEFKQHQTLSHVRSFGVAEGLPLTKSVCGLVLFQERIVEEASAVADVDESYVDANADHISVCKATITDLAVIDKLFKFITNAAPHIHQETIANIDLYVPPPVPPSPTVSPTVS